MARVHRVDHPEGWAVLDEQGIPIPEVSAFLRHLHSIERSPNTRKGYASDLALFFSFSQQNGLRWAAVDNEGLGRFIQWMRTPNASLVHVGNLEGVRSRRTVNRAMAAVTGFAQYLYDTTGDAVYGHLVKTARSRAVRFGENMRAETRVGPRLREIVPSPETLGQVEVSAILDACLSLRDRLLFSVLSETGMRIGQALLLRHDDFRVQTSSIWVQRRESDRSREDQLRNKSANFAEVPVPPWLVRLYAAYVNTEFGLLDCDFVFVNLWSGRVGEQMTYTSVDKLVGRLRRRTGIEGWSAHTFRHTYVTRLLNAGLPPEAVAYLVTHASVITTLNTYSHSSVEDIRAQLIRTGVWSDAG